MSQSKENPLGQAETYPCEARALRTLIAHFLSRVGDLPEVVDGDTSVLLGTKLGPTLREFGFDVELDDDQYQWVLYFDVVGGGDIVGGTAPLPYKTEGLKC